jgi:hypothetical protein
MDRSASMVSVRADAEFCRDKLLLSPPVQPLNAVAATTNNSVAKNAIRHEATKWSLGAWLFSITFSNLKKEKPV